jgi:hypothetical protein
MAWIAGPPTFRREIMRVILTGFDRGEEPTIEFLLESSALELTLATFLGCRTSRWMLSK